MSSIDENSVTSNNSKNLSQIRAKQVGHEIKFMHFSALALGNALLTSFVYTLKLENCGLSGRPILCLSKFEAD
jgi:hypothetical protein